MVNPAQMIPVKRWVSVDYNMLLFRIDNKIKIKVLNNKSRDIRTFLYNPVDIDAFVKKYLYSVVIMEGDKPHFLNCRWQWVYKELKISLQLSKPGDLIGHIYAEKEMEALQFECDADWIVPSGRCHSDTVALIEKAKSKSMADFVDIMKDFKVTFYTYHNEPPSVNSADRQYTVEKAAIEKVKKGSFWNGKYVSEETAKYSLPPLVCTPLGDLPVYVCAATSHLFYNALKRSMISQSEKDNAQMLFKRNKKRIQALETRPLIIEVEPRSQKSKIDDKVLVSKFMWAVTMIANQGSNGNHAQLIVEGLNNSDLDLGEIAHGNYFASVYHLQNATEISIALIKGEIRYQQRTQVWKVNSQKVVKMLDSIAEEKRKMEDDGYQIEYDELGPSISKPNANNCCSWLIGHLKAAEIGDLETKSSFGTALFPARVRSYTEYGNSFFLGLDVPFSPTVMYNTAIDESDFSEETIIYKESL